MLKAVPAVSKLLCKHTYIRCRNTACSRLGAFHRYPHGSLAVVDLQVLRREYSMDGLPASTGISKQLWDDALSIAYQSLHSPFVISLAQGDLPKETFQQHIAQDAFFLEGFAKAYALAMAKAGELEERQFALLSDLLRGVQKEVQLHRSFMEEWGLNPADVVVPNPATTAYVDFLLNIASSNKGVEHILAAMLPCSRLYGFIGCQLAAAYTAAEGQYGSWIKTYSSADYLALPAQKEQLLDEIAGDIPYGELRTLYRKAMQLEVDFFCAQPRTPQSRNIQLVVADFDETLTVADTISPLLALSATAAEKVSGPAGKEAVEQRVAALSHNYAVRYQQLMKELLVPEAAATAPSQQPTRLQTPSPPSSPAISTMPTPPAGGEDLMAAASAGRFPGKLLVQTKSIESDLDSAASDEIDLEEVAALLHRLSDFDTEMNRVVEEAGVLAGVSLEEIREAGRRIPLREGARQVLRKALDTRRRVHVVSVNWSAEYLAAALQLPHHLATGSATSPGRRPQIVIHANQLEVDEGGITTGKIDKRLENARDKGLVFEDLLMGDAGGSPPRRTASSASFSMLSINNNNGGSGISNGLTRSWSSNMTEALPGALLDQSSSGFDIPCSIYIGDSASDVLPLMEADFGVVIGTNKVLRQVLKQFGIPLKPLCAAPLVPPMSGGSSPVLYEAKDWQELAAFIFGPETTPIAASRLRHVASQRGLEAGGREGRRAHIPRVLTIAGSDSGGGAGIQADLKTCLARGVFGMSAVTALTAQNTHGVQGVQVTPLDFLAEQIDCVLDDIGADVVKTGMLPNAEAVALVAEKVSERKGLKVVVDPVMVSTSGHSLAEGGVAATLLEKLAPLATVLTPNIPEASALLGGMQISSIGDMRAAAKQLHAFGPKYVLLKGGHLLDGAGGQAVDVLYDGKDTWELREQAVATRNSHGTGCTLASAIAAELAKGQDVPGAVATAKHYITQALHHSSDIAIGSGTQRPFNHGYAIADWSGRGPRGARPLLDLRVYAVTDPHCNKLRNRSMEEAVRAACEGGVTILQLREKDCDGGDFLATAVRVVQIAHGYGVPVLINDRVDVALASGADGVHVGQSDLPAAATRHLIGSHKLLGVSVKSVEEAMKAQADGADYVGAGAVFPTSTKDSSVMGLEVLSGICGAITIPVVSIGGVNADNAAATIRAGCAGCAVVSGIFASDDPTAATQRILKVVNDSLAAVSQQ